MNKKTVRLIIIYGSIIVLLALWQLQTLEQNETPSTEPVAESTPENPPQTMPEPAPENEDAESKTEAANDAADELNNEISEAEEALDDSAAALEEQIKQAQIELKQSWSEWSTLLVAATSKVGKKALIESPTFAALVAQNPSEIIDNNSAPELADIEAQTKQLRESIQTLSKLYPSIAAWQTAKAKYDKQLRLWDAFKNEFQVDLSKTEADKVAYLETKITQTLKAEDYKIAARSADVIRDTYQSWSEQYTQDLIALATPKMVDIPSGEFLMGDLNSQGQKDELPALMRQVSAFKMSETEITFEQYDAYLIYNVLDLNDDSGWGRSKRPVVDVNYSDAANFASWLSEVTKRRFALPSEVQWEYAARATTTSPFAFGNDLTQKARCEGCDAWSQTQSLEVKQFQANQFGLYDMHGNVWEWVGDCYTSSYNPSDTAPSETCEKRIARGGGWRDLPGALRSANRNPVRPDAKSNQLGFRLVEIQ